MTTGRIVITFTAMQSRWSRLALAAILAFGASPGLAAAAAAERGCATTCCGDVEAAAPSLVASVVVDSFHRCHGVRHATPVCASAPAAMPPPRTVVVERVASGAADHVPVAREPSWRLAPKTSPPGR